MRKTLFLLFAMALMASCVHIKIDDIKKGIVETESKELPMTVQKLEGVKEIKIDSLVVVNNTEPYYGYLVTTWKMEKEYRDYRKYGETYEINPQVNVEVRDITVKGSKYSWRTNWYGAYTDIKYDDTY